MLCASASAALPPFNPTPGMVAMAQIGEIDTAVTPMITGSPMPIGAWPTQVFRRFRYKASVPDLSWRTRM
jgi:hypothetical protein